jgi:hypothetical protein
MGIDLDITTVGTALLVLGVAYLLSGLVFLLPTPTRSRSSSLKSPGD